MAHFLIGHTILAIIKILIGENIKGTLILETKKPSLIEKIVLEIINNTFLIDK